MYNSVNLVAVVMPVYNAMPYLDRAIESILDQTYRTFQFVIYDDYSTDGSYERALDWAARDPRISVSRGSERLGPTASSAVVAELAQSKLVARMDADDIAHPERLEAQVAALLANDQAVLVGSTMEMIDKSGKIIRRAEPGRIAGKVHPFCHPSILYRREAFERAGGYRAGTDYFEDVDLYRRMSREGTLLVINRPLIQTRFAGQNTRLKDNPFDVLRRIDRHYVGPRQQHGEDSRLSPMAFYSVAVLSILSLQRPRLLGLMLRHAKRNEPVTYIKVLVMLIIAEASPRCARGLGSLLSFVRNVMGSKNFVSGAVYPWVFPESQINSSVGQDQAPVNRASRRSNTDATPSA